MRVLVSVVILIVFLFFFEMYNLFPLKYYDEVLKYSGSLDPLLVLSIIRVESSFRENAVSPYGAVGLMQVTPDTAEWLNKKYRTNFDVNNPSDNIALGCMYLQYLLEKDGNLETALIHYNTGPYASEEIKVDAGNRYVNKVMRAYKVYKLLYRR